MLTFHNIITNRAVEAFHCKKVAKHEIDTITVTGPK
jgi:hypothetical protein